MPRGLIRLTPGRLNERRCRRAGDRRRASHADDREDVGALGRGRVDCQGQRRGSRRRIRAEVPGRSRREATDGAGHRRIETVGWVNGEPVDGCPTSALHPDQRGTNRKRIVGRGRRCWGGSRGRC